MTDNSPKTQAKAFSRPCLFEVGGISMIKAAMHFLWQRHVDSSKLRPLVSHLRDAAKPLRPGPRLNVVSHVVLGRGPIQIGGFVLSADNDRIGSQKRHLVFPSTCARICQLYPCIGGNLNINYIIELAPSHCNDHLNQVKKLAW